jgi:hypothetical protein
MVTGTGTGATLETAKVVDPWQPMSLWPVSCAVSVAV